MAKNRKTIHKISPRTSTEMSRLAIFGISLSALAAIPLAMSTGVHRIYLTPKLTLLLIAAAALLPLLIFTTYVDRRNQQGFVLKRPLKSLAAVFAYVSIIALATIFGRVPQASLFGSFENQMGLITHVCFLICCVGLVVSINARESRLRAAAITISVTTLVVSAYALSQYFGVEPFVSRDLYTFNSAYGSVLRVGSFLGHADFLGNFLLYATPLSFALAFSSQGAIRWLTATSAITSLCAIVTSGTRGAWVGIIIGLFSLIFFALRGREIRLRALTTRKVCALTTIVLVITTAAGWAILSAERSQSLSARIKETFADGLSGSGRTLLWRDALAMVPDYALFGCGPDAFRLAFLPYRSVELSRLAPLVIDESAHNSYLDVLISFGILGLFAYGALIVGTLAMFIIAFRNAQNTRSRFMIAGFLASYVAVLAHNLFIFDQITTGLYFYSFAGLALCCLEVTGKQASSSAKQNVTFAALSRGAKAFFGLAIFVSLTGLWYSLTIWQEDENLKQMFSAASAGSINSVITCGTDLTEGDRLTGDVDLQFAMALSQALENSQGTLSNEARNPANQNLRKQALDLAIKHAERGVRNSLIPTCGYLLIGTLALQIPDVDRLRKAACEAYKVDPQYFGSHWLLAEMHLVDGNHEEAIKEAQIALNLNPVSKESLSALERAGGIPTETALLSESMEAGFKLMEKGQWQKATRVFMRALRKSNGVCFDCHLGLADVYERTGKRSNAVAELQAAIRDDPANSEVEKIRKRIENLQSRDIGDNKTPEQGKL